MKIKPIYKLRQVAGETIVVNQGTHQVNMTRIISLNSSARLLYETLAEREDFTIEDVIAVLIDTYDISRSRAYEDALSWVEALKICDVIE